MTRTRLLMTVALGLALAAPSASFAAPPPSDPAPGASTSPSDPASGASTSPSGGPSGASLAPVAAPSDPDAAFAAANAAFYAGDYPAARAGFEALVARDDVADAALWHNLGNARFRVGAYGAAIHAYRSGLLRESSDAGLVDALRRNLETTRRVLQSRYRTAGEAGFVFAEPGGVAWQLGHLLGLQTLSIAFGVAWLALMGLLIARRLRPASARAAGRLALVAVLVVALTGALLTLRLTSDADHQLAVVASPEAQLRDGPHPTAQGKPLPEGLEVRLVGETEGWAQVELVGGRRGWVDVPSLLAFGASPASP
jgi:hypothetical protein